jgi:hypothetical protein
MSYEKKFAHLGEAKREGAMAICVRDPESLGDDYDEIMETLNRFADAGLAVEVVPRSERPQAAADHLRGEVH